VTIAFCLLFCGLLSFSVLAKQAITQPHEKPIPDEDIARLARAVHVIQLYYIKPVSDSVLLENAIRGMASQLDPHSTLLNKEELDELETVVSGEFVGIGVELTTEHGMLKVISPIDGTPAHKAGIKAGDYIVKINQNLVQNMSLREAIHQIKGKAGTQVILTIVRKNEPKPLTLIITREIVKIQAVSTKILAPGYVDIRLAFFQGPVEKQISHSIEKIKKESHEKIKGLVLDLRDNPGGLLDASAEIANLFLDNTARYHNLLIYTKGRISTSNVTFHAHPKDIIKEVPMVVLINNGSASASEIVAGALQDYRRAIIMGTRSFGKGSVQTVIPIGKKSALKLTTALYYTPAGREIQAHGIEPDVVVPELSVNGKKEENFLKIDEENYDHHIKNADQFETKTTKAEQKVETDLARQDYQLYQALVMLQGMHVLHLK